MVRDKQLFYRQIREELASLRAIKKSLLENSSFYAAIKNQDKFSSAFAEIVYSVEGLGSNKVVSYLKNLVLEISGGKFAFIPQNEEIDVKSLPIKFDGQTVGYIHPLNNIDAELVEQESRAIINFLSLLISYLEGSKNIEFYFNRIEILNNITLIINSSLNMDEVYQGFAREIKKMVEFDRISIATAEGEGSIRVLGIEASMETKLSKGVVIPRANTCPGWVLESNKTFIANDLWQEKKFWEDDILASEGIRSAIRVPLCVKGKVVATLNLNSKKPNVYGHREQILLEQVARQISTAVQNAQLFAEAEKQSLLIQQQNTRLSALNAISEVVGGSLDLCETLRASLAKVNEVLGTEAGAIFLINEDTNELELQIHSGISADCLSVMDSKLVNESIAGKVTKTSEPVIFFNGNSDRTGCLFGNQAEFHILSYIPLKSRNRVIGVMPVGTANEAGVACRDWELLVSIGNQIGVAIENARLYQKIKHMAEFDGLTQVYNRRIFYKLLEKETSRADRHGLIFSVLMLDVDLFKEYNDQFGHLVGDEVLRETARILRENVREADIVARFGGEEFVILAVESSKEQALEMAERIRKIIEEKGTISAFPTISIGVASFPEDGLEAEELIRNADFAMYKAKEKRNQVVAFSSYLFEERLTKA